MKHLPSKFLFKHRFDFEIGVLVKSPCRDCKTRKRFPRCIDECKVLDRLHTVLANTVSCTKRV